MGECERWGDGGGWDEGDEAMLSGWDRTGHAGMPRTSVKLSTDRAAAAAVLVHKS